MPLLDPDLRAARAARVARAFSERYDGPPAVVGVAPGRVNLIGEHTDYNHGLVLPVALPHSTWAAARTRDDDRMHISSAQQEGTWTGSLDDLGPGRATGWPAYVAGVVWALGESGAEVTGLDLHVDSTVPVGAGLSSSAALECAVAVAVTSLWGQGDAELYDAVRDTLVAACIRAETEVARAPTGGMDQTIAIYGRAGHAVLIDFDTAGPGGGAPGPARRAVPLPLADDALALLVTDTRVSHALVDGGYGSRRDECVAAAERLGVAHLRATDLDAVESLSDDTLRRRARHIVTENDRVSRVVDALEHSDLDTVGALMVASHASMRDDFEISCAELDVAVDAAVRAGALGARMTGGGFGGSSVALVRREALPDVVAAIDAAFATAGYAAPAHLDAVPSDGAEVLRIG